MNRFRCRLQLNLNTFAGVRHPCRSGSGRRHTSFTRFFKARLGTLRLRITKVGLFPELTNLFHSRFARRKRRKAHAATGAEPANHASANHFVKPSAEPNEVRTMPRREMDERNSTISSSRAQSRTKFGLCLSEKWSMQTHESARPAEVRRRLCYSLPSHRQMKRTATG